MLVAHIGFSFLSLYKSGPDLHAHRFVHLTSHGQWCLNARSLHAMWQ